MLVIMVLAMVVFLPSWLVDLDLGGSRVAPDERLTAINNARGTLLQAAAGVFLAVGAYATWRRVRINEEELQASRDGQVTERYARAVEHLGHASTDVRMGGLFALERISRNSPRDRDAIIAIVSAYVRGHSPWPPSDPAADPDADVPSLALRAYDVQAAITVLGRLRQEETDELIRIPRTDLRNARMWGLRFDRAIVSNCALRGARLSSSVLRGADLGQSDARGARFDGSDLCGANLRGADLRHSGLSGADLRESDLTGALLAGARADQATRWPVGFDPGKAGVTFVDAS
jgi:hypothetical protein